MKKCAILDFIFQEIHEKEKLLQRMQTEIAEAEMKKVMDEESSRQMM